MSEEPRYWFPAKRYGWGWGPPTRWEGWAVLVAFVAVLATLGVLVAPRSLPVYLACATIAAGGLVTVCYRKGEPPRWRWGA